MITVINENLEKFITQPEQFERIEIRGRRDGFGFDQALSDRSLPQDLDPQYFSVCARLDNMNAILLANFNQYSSAQDFGRMLVRSYKLPMVSLAADTRKALKAHAVEKLQSLIQQKLEHFHRLRHVAREEGELRKQINDGIEFCRALLRTIADANEPD